MTYFKKLCLTLGAAPLVVLCFCAFIMFSLQELVGQARVRAGTTSFNETMKRLSDMHSRYNYEDISSSYDEYNGTPFFTDDFIPTNISAHKGETFENVMTRMDLYINEIFAKDEEGKDFILDKTQYREISFDKDSESYRFGRVHPQYPKDFYEILYDGSEIMVFKKHEVKLRKAENNGLSKSKGSFAKAKKFYVKNKTTKQTERIKLNKKNLVRYLNAQEIILMNRVTREKGMKSPKEKDFKEIFNDMSQSSVE